MRFKLTTPCAQCPFRTDIEPYLTRARAREIGMAITLKQQTFSCHKTTLGEWDDDGESYQPTGKEQHCAGALILLEKLGKPNQLMRIAERIRQYDRRRLDMEAPVVSTVREFIDLQGKR